MEVELALGLVISISGLLLLISTGSLAQAVDFPPQPAKTPEAKAAGIGSYHVSRQGKTATVEAFDAEGEPLADCEAQWREVSSSLSCTMPDGQRFRATWYAERAEFEDLGTGEHIALYKGESATEPAAGQPDRGGWVIDGSKTWEEVERDWRDTTAIFGNLMVEIEITTGVLAERLARIRSGELSIDE